MDRIQWVFLGLFLVCSTSLVGVSVSQVHENREFKKDCLVHWELAKKATTIQDAKEELDIVVTYLEDRNLLIRAFGKG